MTRPTFIHIDTSALLHNLKHIKTWAADRRIVAMVKANAYGCGLKAVVPAIKEHVDTFGVASLEEALALRCLAPQSSCLLVEGFFTPDELPIIDDAGFQIVIHHAYQLDALLKTPLKNKLKIWVKLDTGMHRLGFKAAEIPDVMHALTACPWIMPKIGIMSHFANADEPANAANEMQMLIFKEVSHRFSECELSFCNSAANLRTPPVMGEVVRIGIMLYGISPFVNHTGAQYGLKPVMHLRSKVISIKYCPTGEKIGYGGIWTARRPSLIAVVACGYGDGYPRHIAENTQAWINHQSVPIIGRVSMDMLTIDVTDLKIPAIIGSDVELWGEHIPIERIAQSAGTIAYELLCQTTQRPYRVID